VAGAQRLKVDLLILGNGEDAMNAREWLRLQWDRVAAWVCVAVGVIVLLIGWLGVSGTGYPAEQMPYVLSAGIGGIFLLGIGAMLWLSADLRDEWRKLDRIERALWRIAENGENGHGAVVEADGQSTEGSINGRRVRSTAP
jgi:hypothetical protein